MTLSKHDTYLLWQKLAAKGCSTLCFNELRAFLKERAGGRRVLEGTETDLRRRAEEISLDYEVKKMRLFKTKDSDTEGYFVVSRAPTLEELVEKEYADLGDDFLPRAIAGRLKSANVALMMDKGQGWTTCILVVLDKTTALSAQNAAILARWATLSLIHI